MIKLDLEINEVNIILRALGKQSFEEVASVVLKIKQQGDPQVPTPTETETVDATATAEASVG